MRPDDQPALRNSDAAWLRRGQQLGEAMLTARKHAGYGWATALTLAGGSLIALALIGPFQGNMPEGDMPTAPTITSNVAAPR